MRHLSATIAAAITAAIVVVDAADAASVTAGAIQ